MQLNQLGSAYFSIVGLYSEILWYRLNGSVVRLCPLSSSLYLSLQVPEVDTAVRSLTVMWDGSLVVAANNNGTCYVWRLSRGTQVSAPSLYDLALAFPCIILRVSWGVEPISFPVHVWSWKSCYHNVATSSTYHSGDATWFLCHEFNPNLSRNLLSEVTKCLGRLSVGTQDDLKGRNGQKCYPLHEVSRSQYKVLPRSERTSPY